MVERLDYTRAEWNQLPTETRVQLLNQEAARKELESAITNIGCLVGKNPIYKNSWRILKKYLDREVGVQLKIH